MKKRDESAVSPYDSLIQPVVEEHPVDLLVERRCPQKHLRRRVRRASERLLSGLGENRRYWLVLERLLNEYGANRERACFDLGYERGARIGRADALRGAPSRRETGPLVERIWQLVDEAGLVPAARVAALLEAMWPVALELAPGQRRQPKGTPNTRVFQAWKTL